MKVRGERECSDCGTRWSYYETGSVACPDCESIRSVGVGDRTLHTDGPADLDLSAVRSLVDAEPLDRVAERAVEEASAYTRQAGFVDGGTLQPLSGTYLAATELRTVATAVAGEMRPDDETELYFLTLLGGAEDGDRPAPAEVPGTLRAERGLAVARAVEAYHRDLRTYFEDRDRDAETLMTVLSGLRTRRKRIEALEGDVDPATAERLVRVCRDVYDYLTTADETALARASDRLAEDPTAT